MPELTLDTPVLDHGYVRVVEYMGSDARIAACARVSTARHNKNVDESADAGLISRLMRDSHSSPFEHAVFTFEVRAPIFVARQWMRYRFSSFNEESGRYVKLQDEFYVPDELRVQVGKAMDYQYIALPEDIDTYYRQLMHEHFESGRKLYERLLDARVAREHARLVLPVAQYTTFIWTVNVLSLMNFLYQRTDPHAQAEIRAYAEAIEHMFAERFPMTHQAFRQFWGYGKIV